MTAKGSAIKRATDWVWQAGALRALRADRPKSLERQLQYLGRSRSAFAIGRIALAPPTPSRDASMVGVACELYREATYWGLMAQRASAEAETPRENLDALFRSADRNLLEHAAGDATRLAEIEQAIASKDFVDLAELPSVEQARLAERLEPFAEALSSGIDSRELAIQRILARRIRAIVTLVVLILVAIWGVGILREHAVASSDLARDKPWVASSNGGAGCVSPDQDCAPDAGFFVHTNEEANPWVVFDLEKPRSVSGARVLNRIDCCQERGLPLVIELSSDQQTWKQVARRDSQFQSWEVKFPTTEARYVRFRAESKTFLHLSQVRIFP